MYRLDNLLISSSYLEKVEDDRNAETFNPTPEFGGWGNGITGVVKLNFKSPRKGIKGVKALRYNFKSWAKNDLA